MVGSATEPRNPQQVILRGNYLYVVDWGDWQDGTGLHIFDAVDPAQLVEVAAIGPPHATDFLASGNTALVVDQGEGLHLFDVTNPHAPVEVGRAATTGAAWSVEMGHGRAIVSTLDAGVSLFGLSTPCLPGDCDLDGTVSIGEVQKVINAFLGLSSTCL